MLQHYIGPATTTTSCIAGIEVFAPSHTWEENVHISGSTIHYLLLRNFHSLIQIQDGRCLHHSNGGEDEARTARSLIAHRGHNGRPINFIQHFDLAGLMSLANNSV
jgi:hypothetical protein